MIELTEAQTWTVIATLSAALLGMITVVTTVLMRTIGAQIGSLRSEMISGLDGVRSEIGGLRAEMNARFETVGVRMDSLDRDVQAVASRVFGTDRP
ncbi:MAG: hypothetical protein WA006_07740 [Rhodoglobus sp.]